MPPRFTWNEKAARFVGPGGRFVSGARLRGALDKYLDEKTVWGREWAGQLQRREITIAQWQRGMETELIKGHLNSAALKRGGAARMDDAALAKAGEFLRSELGHLAELAAKIEAGLPLDGRFLQRVDQYMQAPREHYHEIEREIETAKGANQERSVRSLGDSCTDCVYWDGVSWQPINTVPTPGGTGRKCRRKCKCLFEFRFNAMLNAAGTGPVEPPSEFQSDPPPAPLLVPPSTGGTPDEPVPDAPVREDRPVADMIEAGAAEYEGAQSSGSLIESSLLDTPLAPSVSGQAGDSIVPQLAQRQGITGPPTVVTRAEMEALKKHLDISYPKEDFPQFVNDYRALPLYRGLSTQGSVRQNTTPFDTSTGAQGFLRGDYFVGETGAFGKGIYFTAVASTAKGQYARDESGAVIHAILKSEAKLVRYSTLMSEMRTERATIQTEIKVLQGQVLNGEMTAADFEAKSLKLQQAETIANNPGYYAAARGYDAMVLNDDRTGEPNVVVFNRTALFVQEDTGFDDY